jgi:LssY-like putative type I secretion system component LssY
VTAIAAGAKLSGKTADVKAAPAANSSPSSGAAQPATLRLAIDKIQFSDGHNEKLPAQLSAVDNARESIGSDGLITGILASETWYGRMNSGITKVENSHPGLASILGSVRDSFVKQVDASINYPSGVDMQLKLTSDLKCTPPGNPPILPAIQPADQIANLANTEPNRTVAGNPPKPSDLTNLMFIGTDQELQSAFKAAGWSAAAANGSASNMETARAIIENRGYKEAPVSLLLLDGHAPDFVFQKQTNTFAMRHHIRIWKRPDLFAGKPVWVAAATHDTGIDFSQESHTFTHKIDSNIDLERAKVANDLAFSGYLQAFSLVPRSNVPKDISNATGDVLKTDEKMAVMQFQAQAQGHPVLSLN